MDAARLGRKGPPKKRKKGEGGNRRCGCWNGWWVKEKRFEEKLAEYAKKKEQVPY